MRSLGTPGPEVWSSAIAHSIVCGLDSVAVARRLTNFRISVTTRTTVADPMQTSHWLRSSATVSRNALKR